MVIYPLRAAERAFKGNLLNRVKSKLFHTMETGRGCRAREGPTAERAK
jgi:hypothetical protein